MPGTKKNTNYTALPECYYTVKEAAHILKISADTIFHRTKAGTFPCRKIGRRVLIPASFVHGDDQQTKKKSK